jgi:hypothetical protein
LACKWLPSTLFALELQFALAGDTVQIADEQHAQQELGINRGPSGLAVSASQLLPHKLEADVLVDEPQQMVFRNLIFEAEVIEQRFGAVVLPHHDQQASDDQNQQSMGRCLLLAWFC